MIRALWAMLVVLSLSGCVSTGDGYFAREAAGYEGRMAQDAVAQIKRMYVPASTRFAIVDDGRNPFATALAGALRHQGYAVAGDGGYGIAVQSVVDALPDDMYRVTLRVGGEELSRAYAVATDGNTYPASYWARCEAPEHGTGAIASTRRPPPPADAHVVAQAQLGALVASGYAPSSIDDQDDVGQRPPPEPPVQQLAQLPDPEPEAPALDAITATQVPVVPIVPIDVPAADPIVIATLPLSVPEIPGFAADAGGSVRDVIEAWGQQANWDVKWVAKIDYPVPAAVSFDGGFLDAVRYVLGMYAHQARPLVSDAYMQQSLVVVKESK